MEYRRGSHTKYKIEYHFVWVTKYRYHMLQGDLASRLRELVRQVCEQLEIQILRGVVSKDHVHILVSAPPNLAPSEIMISPQIIRLRQNIPDLAVGIFSYESGKMKILGAARSSRTC